MIVIAACMLSCLAAPQPQGAGQRRGDFEVVLYLHGGPQRDADFFRRVGDLGFTAVSIPAGGDPRPAINSGLGYYLDQILGKGVLALSDQQWRPVFQAYQESRDPNSLVRPVCLSEEKQRRSLAALLESRAVAVAEHPPLAVSLGDEISLTLRANPLDLCQHQACQEAFKTFLRGRYGSIINLNRAWNSNYSTFFEVRPWTVDQMRSRELGGAKLPENLRPWSDHLQFRDFLLRDVIESLVERCRGILPQSSCGLTGMQPPSAYGGHNYALLMPILSFFEAYDIGGARDLATSLAPPGALQMTTIMPAVAGEPLRLPEARVYEALAQGMSGVIVWNSGRVFGANRETTSFGESLRELLQEARPAMTAFAGARINYAPIWLVESQSSIRAHWMIDSAGDGETWIRRLSSYEASHSTSLAARESWTRLLEDLGLQPRWVSEEQITMLLEEHGPKLLVLPASIALSTEAVGAIDRYVRAGGHLLADHGTAIYNQHLVRRPRAGLDHVFGITGRSVLWRDLKLREGRPYGVARLSSGAAAVELGLEAEIAEQNEGYAVQIEHPFGRGTAVYLNLAVCEYAGIRLLPSRVKAARDLRARVRRVVEAAGIVEPVSVRGKSIPTCIERTLLTSKDGRKLLSIRLNATQAPDLLTRIAARGPVQLSLEFPQDVVLRDLLSDQDLGTGRRFEVDLDPWRALLLSLEIL